MGKLEMWITGRDFLPESPDAEARVPHIGVME
jgi:hypothetical protein